MKDESISFIIDETPVTLSYNRFESNHAWEKKVVVSDIELELFGVPDMSERDMKQICVKAIKNNEHPYETIIE